MFLFAVGVIVALWLGVPGIYLAALSLLGVLGSTALLSLSVRWSDIHIAHEERTAAEAQEERLEKLRRVAALKREREAQLAQAVAATVDGTVRATSPAISKSAAAAASAGDGFAEKFAVMEEAFEERLNASDVVLQRTEGGLPVVPILGFEVHVIPESLSPRVVSIAASFDLPKKAYRATGKSSRRKLAMATLHAVGEAVCRDSTMIRARYGCAVQRIYVSGWLLDPGKAKPRETRVCIVAASGTLLQWKSSFENLEESSSGTGTPTISSRTA